MVDSTEPRSDGDVQYAIWNMLYLLDASNHRNDINFIVNRPVLKTLNPQLWTLPVEISSQHAANGHGKKRLI